MLDYFLFNIPYLLEKILLHCKKLLLELEDCPLRVNQKKKGLKKVNRQWRKRKELAKELFEKC
jgi:hypothetical protein